MREADPFSHALGTLRAKLRAGAYGEGEPLTVVDLAREMKLSATPVREALFRLAGEGLVEDRRGRGFFNWRLDVVDLVELYDLEALYLGGAIEALSASCEAEVSPTPVAAEALEENVAALAQTCERLLDEIVRASGSRMLRAGYTAVADRLSPVRLAEMSVLKDVRQELAGLGALFEQGRYREMSAELHAFQERRRNAAAATLAVLRKRRLRTSIS